ncbi:DUF2740 family protein [Salmonella enterica]
MEKVKLILKRKGHE